MFKHTSTEINVLARNEATSTASIVIGTKIMAVGGETGIFSQGANTRYERHKKACEEDAAGIYELLNEHLPEETRAHLACLYKRDGT